MKSRAYVVDDEPLAVERLVRMLDATGRVIVAGSTVSPEAALADLEREPVDVLFLDIMMPGMSGFDLVARLTNPPWIVFTTAFDAFALQAFDVNAIDYLLKPVEVSHLERALDKLERAGGVRVPLTDLRKVLEDVVHASRRPSAPYADRLASRLGDRVCFLDVVTITHLYAEDKLTYAVSDGKSYSIDAPLTELEQRLDPRRFLRVHRSTLVGLRWIAEARADASGGLVLQLHDATRTRIDVARSRTAGVKARLGI